MFYLIQNSFAILFAVPYFFIWLFRYFKNGKVVDILNEIYLNKLNKEKLPKL